MFSRTVSSLLGAGFILLGLASGYIFGESYSGKFLISYLLNPGKHRLLRNEVVVPPNVAYNYQHHLSKFPDEVLKFGPELKVLRIISGSIKTVPEGIGNLAGLTVLEISDNRLANVPTEIGNLTQLTELNLAGNGLTSLPLSIGGLTNLKKLSLDDNQLTALPSQIGSLTSLETLDLHLNALTSLPETIVSLSNLKVLYLGGNPLPAQEKEKIQKLLPNTLIFF